MLRLRAPYMSQTLAADAVLLLVAAIWGGGFIAAKEALHSMTPMSVLCLRFLLSAAVMFVMFPRRICRCRRQDIRLGILIGIIQFAAFIFQLNGLVLTTVEKQSFLITSYVVFVPFLSWLAVRRPIRRLDIACSFLAMLGLALLCLHSGQIRFAAGDLLSLAAAVCFGFQIVYVGNFVKTANIYAMSFFQLLTPGIVALPFAVPVTLPSTDIHAVLGIAYLVLFNTAFAFSAQNIAQQYTSDAHASLLISFESVFGFLLAVWFYGSTVTLQEIAGCACMLAAVLLSRLCR